MSLLGVGYGYGFDTSATLDVSIGTPNGEPIPVVADPRREYVSSNQIFDVDRGFLAIEDRFGGPLAWHGVAEYERMYHTPAVGSSFNALRAAVLSNGINLLPAVKPQSERAKSGQIGGTDLEADMAAEICESNARTINAWETPADLVIWEHMEDMFLGHVLSEIVADDIVGGPDDGLLAIKAVKPKPRNSYRFRVDRAMNVLSIGALSFDDATGSTSWQQFDADKFAWSTWDSHRGDPRGRSCFRMAHYHWRLLMDLWPEVWKGWRQFGVPMLWGNTAPGAKMVDRVGKDGKPLAGAGVTAEFAMAMKLQSMRAGDAAAGPFDSSVKVIESTKDASVASGGIDILEGQIIRSILLQLRATTEAQHGSKADSQTGQDIMGTLVRFVRKGRERFLRQLLMRQNTWNYGDDIARRLTPLVDLGGTEHMDFPANSAGVATLFQSSYFTDSQLPYVDTFLGMPQRQAGEMRVGPNGTMPDGPAPDPKAPTEPTGQGGAA